MDAYSCTLYADRRVCLTSQRVNLGPHELAEVTTAWPVVSRLFARFREPFKSTRIFGPRNFVKLPSAINSRQFPTFYLRTRAPYGLSRARSFYPFTPASARTLVAV